MPAPSLLFPETPAISAKRKPPSQRPERQLDDVARAIARQAEADKPDKGGDADRSTSEVPRTRTRLAPPGLSVNTRNVGGQAPNPSTKRPKKGG